MYQIMNSTYINSFVQWKAATPDTANGIFQHMPPLKWYLYHLWLYVVGEHPHNITEWCSWCLFKSKLSTGKGTNNSNTMSILAHTHLYTQYHF